MKSDNEKAFDLVTISTQGRVARSIFYTRFSDSHQICNVVVEELLLDGIRRVTGFARDYEDEFVEMVTKKTKIDLDKSMRDNKREIEQSQARISKLDEIIQRLYEDNIEGRRIQRIKIVYNCIGEFDPPVSTSTTEQEKSA